MNMEEMNYKNLADSLRKMVEHKQNYLRDTTYSLEFRERKREEADDLEQAAKALEQLEYLINLFKRTFKI